MLAVVQCPFLGRLERDGFKRERRWITRDGGAKRQRTRGESGPSMDGSDDVVYEVMKHMDAKCLAVAACVSKKWKKIAEDETLWENLCIQRWSSPVSSQNQLRSVVLALGGFRRLYVRCLRPLSERGRKQPQSLSSSLSSQPSVDREWTKDEVHLSLSLFSIDCYERLGRRQLNHSSLKLLCKPSANLSLGRHHMFQLRNAESNVR